MKDQHHGTPKGQHPTSTVSQSRVPIFAPVTRKAPNKVSRGNVTFKTSWGTCTIQDCQLTQVHRDFIDSILTYHDNITRHDTGDITYYVKPYAIMKKMGWSRPNTTWFNKIIEELRTTTLHLHELSWRITVGIVIRHKYISSYINQNSSKFGQEMPYAVQFSSEFLKIFQLETRVHYPRLLDSVLAIESPLIRALVRYCFTHNNVFIRLDNLLEILGAIDNQMSSRARRAKLAELRNSTDLLSIFGITISGEILRYKKHDYVYFTNP